MISLSSIPVRKTGRSRLAETDFQRLEFGKHAADHMLVCDYYDGEWQQAQIVPYANLALSPSTLAFHYGQTVFEGMKAFRTVSGEVNIFRIGKHYDRFSKSLERMCMAIPPAELFEAGLKELVALDRDWVPARADCALYIRPLVIATEEFFGVRVSNRYRLVIFTAPVPAFFAKPIRLKAETTYVRAARGGTGFAKCGGNYGGAFYPTQLAKEEGFDQVLWTDAAEHRYVEESGMMNIMFVINGTIVTPPLSDTILDGITRDSLLTIARSLGIPVEERPISLDELKTAFDQHKVTEAFGAGTAAVVAPVKSISIGGSEYNLPEYSHENVSAQLKTRLEGIRNGSLEDSFHWNTIV